MNRKEATKMILTSFARLPETLQTVVLSPTLSERVAAIATKRRLPPEKDEPLELQTMFVLIGMLDPAEFVETTATALNVPRNIAEALCQEINEQIFRPVRDELKKLYGMDGGSPAAQAAPGKYAPSVPLPPKKPLAEELEENVGLKAPEAKPISENREPLSMALEQALRNKDFAPQLPMSTHGVDMGSGRPSAPPSPTPPAPPSMSRFNLDMRDRPPIAPPPAAPREMPQRPHREINQLEIGSPQKPTPKTLPTAPQGQSLVPRTVLGGSAQIENEENLNREEILRGIENPESIEPTQAAPRKLPQSYNTDPYREPME